MKVDKIIFLTSLIIIVLMYSLITQLIEGPLTWREFGLAVLIVWYSLDFRKRSRTPANDTKKGK